VSHRIAVFAAAALLAGAAAGCGGEDDGVVVYTSVTQETVDLLVAGFADRRPDTTVDVFRAPTGEIAARIAAEVREGGLQADVLWLTDPLSMQQYDADGLLRAWDPAGAAEIPEAFRADTFWGSRVLNLVVVHRPDLDPPIGTWDDLVRAAAEGGVALPDPGFAGSAFAALGYFALTDGYGMDFYRRLHDVGAVQVAAPGDVVTGVAEGQYAAGITLDFTARTAVEKGSPITVVWPEPGAIALYSPIAAAEGTGGDAAAFVEFVLSEAGQRLVAESGWQPARPDIPWETGGPQVTLDWRLAFDRQEELLGDYRAIFGG
jgi:iron(III) transport system substrate-binding protein